MIIKFCENLFIHDTSFYFQELVTFKDITTELKSI